MLDIAILIILIVFITALIFTFFSYTSFLLNLIILIALYFLITKELKDKDNHKYYLISLLLTAIFFILSNAGLAKNILDFTEKVLLSLVMVSVILLYIFAHIIALIYEYFGYLKGSIRNRQKIS